MLRSGQAASARSGRSAAIAESPASALRRVMAVILTVMAFLPKFFVYWEKA
jgi:hypothetical protein